MSIGRGVYDERNVPDMFSSAMMYNSSMILVRGSDWTVTADLRWASTIEYAIEMICKSLDTGEH